MRNKIQISDIKRAELSLKRIKIWDKDSESVLSQYIEDMQENLKEMVNVLSEIYERHETFSDKEKKELKKYIKDFLDKHIDFIDYYYFQTINIKANEELNDVMDQFKKLAKKSRNYKKS